MLRIMSVTAALGAKLDIVFHSSCNILKTLPSASSVVSYQNMCFSSALRSYETVPVRTNAEVVLTVW